TTMYVASTLTGSRVPSPQALRRLRGVSGLVTDGRRIAYPDGPYKSLWWSPSLHVAPLKVVAARGSNHIDNSVQIGGRYLGFGLRPRVFVGDSKRGLYVAIPAQGVWTRIDSRSLLVVYATPSKKLDARARIAFLPLRRLPPMPACS